jgi:hypothetical protein
VPTRVAYAYSAATRVGTMYSHGAASAICLVEGVSSLSPAQAHTWPSQHSRCQPLSTTDSSLRGLPSQYWYRSSLTADPVSQHRYRSPLKTSDATFAFETSSNDRITAQCPLPELPTVISTRMIPRGVTAGYLALTTSSLLYIGSEQPYNLPSYALGGCSNQ